MDWVTQQYTDPKRVFVSGGSAGAIPSPIFASQLARHYTKAQVVQLGDGAGGYRTYRLAPQLELWGATRALKHDPLYSDLDVETANFEDFYSRAAPCPICSWGRSTASRIASSCFSWRSWATR